ncbi:MAG TPA: NAD(P)-dependent oxidoreductase [Acidimicrobiales bacterium]|nr:NAD(P)-dependent oxidoreductase [Acidimicrobiales bacterium]
MAELNGKRILVVGATGMVASPVVRHLATGNEVWGAARFRNRKARAELEEHGVKTVMLDLADPDFSDLPKDVDYVINLSVSHAPDFSSALASNAENLGLLMAHYKDVTAFLHCSSTGVYQPNGSHPMKEEDPLGDNHRPLLTTYSISKIAAEAVARMSARLHGVPTIIPRLNVPYGEAVAWPSMHLEAILAGHPIQVLPGEETVYSPIHSDDIIRQIPLLLEAASVPAVTVNWAGPDVVSVQEWCRYLGSLVGAEPVFEETTAALPSVAIDVSFMDKLIGPAKVRWQDGMRRMVEASHPERLKP